MEDLLAAPSLRQRRAERLIAGGRAVLSAFSLLAVWLDPTEPSRYAATAYTLLAIYAAYSLLIAALAFRPYALSPGLGLPTVAIDLLVTALVMFFTEGPTSPFFVLFVFALVSAAARSGWTGTLWTAIASLVAFLAIGAYFAFVLNDPTFELNRFIIRTVYLGVVATLIGFLGTFDERLRREISSLTQRPRRTPTSGQDLIGETLERVAQALDLPRLLLVWEDEEEPWLRLAWWTPEGCEWAREPVERYEPLVAERLAGASFYCADAGAAWPTVLYNSDGRLQRFHQAPLHADLRRRFDVGPVLSWRLHGQSCQGRLFGLGDPPRSLDRLLVGEILAWQVAAQLDQLQLLERLREATAHEERLRLARDLHDGVIQSLTVASLRLEAFPRLMETDPEAARREIEQLQDLLGSEQRELRSFVGELRLAVPAPLHAEPGLAARLGELRQRIESHWGLRMETSGNFHQATLSEAMARQIHHVVHEAVINAARHAGGSAVRVGLWIEPREVRIEVTDDGHGFPFAGDYDLPALAAAGLGPVSLRERIAALGGSLLVRSSPRGSELRMTVPLAGGGA